MAETQMFDSDMINFVLSVANVMATLFIVVIGASFIGLVIVYIGDKMQTQNAIQRNYPILGHLRDFFTFLGTFFRQYFFAMDREEQPFNRAQRTWVDHAAKDKDTTVPFGSTRVLRTPGTVLFVNCGFPTLDEDAVDAPPLEIGPYCTQPYLAGSFFNISGMSYGAISKPAVRALSKGAAKAGIWLNTGEGGLSPYHLEGGCDIVFQIGTAKYGVRDEHGHLNDAKLKDIADLPQVKMFELKLSQGAKPGKGGILPAEKVTAEIAKIRGIKKGEASVSPNRHPEVDSCTDLLDVVNHIRSVTGKPVGIKFVVGAYGWIDELCAEILNRGIESAPDFFTIDGADGGTGAAPQSLMDYVGMPLWESLPLVIDKLDHHGLRPRVRVIASSKMIMPSDVAWALAVGADFINNARGFMFALGCIQSLQCNKNTCPTGVATHDKRLQAGLIPADKAVRVANYAKNIVKEVGIIAHSCGVPEPRLLRRYHARIILEDNFSISLADRHPYVTPNGGMPPPA